MFSYQNKLYEVMIFIGLHVSDSFLFHIVECKAPKESWDKLASLFGKVNEFQALQLEVEIPSHVANEHASIEDYIAKFEILAYQRLKTSNRMKSEFP